VTEDDYQYALENTRVVLSPQNRLATFGSSVLNYHLVTEDMDAVNESRVREGSIHAERPEIISPQTMARLLLEGFGDEAQGYAEHLSRQPRNMSLLRYGFRIRKHEIQVYEVHEPFEAVLGKITDQVTAKNDPLAAVIAGVDDGWEVCLLKFMFDTVAASVGDNVSDFKRRGLL